MPTITANKCEMIYEIDDFTDPWVKDKEMVWLQHGVGRNTKFWYHWVPALARQYRVLRRDMRGHGQSADPGPEHRWSLDELVTDMREFMDAMGLQQVHYLGRIPGKIIPLYSAVHDDYASKRKNEVGNTRRARAEEGSGGPSAFVQSDTGPAVSR